MSNDQSGWFSYSPLDPSSLERLNDDQRGAPARQRHERAGADPKVGEVHLFFQSLEPGQVEIRFSGPPTASPTDTLRAAIRTPDRHLRLHRLTQNLSRGQYS